MRALWPMRDFGLVSATIVVLLLIMNTVLIISGIENPVAIELLALFVIQEGIFLLPVYFVVMKKHKLTWQDVGLHKMTVSQAILWTLRGIGLLALLLLIIGALTIRFQEIPGFGAQEPIGQLFGTTKVAQFITAVVVIGLAPFAEEVLFRGFILQSLLLKFRPILASVIGASIFALMHLELQSIFMIFVLGLILNWLFLRSRSLIPCILFHMINNALAFYVESFL